MLTREALLQAVCDNPEDDAARLVYADWLAEHGGPADVARAEFIRLQIARENSPGRSDKNQEREQQLRKEYGEQWLGQLPRLPGVIWHDDYKRGFPWHVSVNNVTNLSGHAETIFQASPVGFLGFWKFHGGMRKLAKLPQLAQVRQLNFGESTVEPEEIAALAQSPFAAGLTHLYLCDACIEDEGLHALATSPYLTRLIDIDLRFNEITDDGLPALAASANLASLEYLGLGDHGIGDEGARLFLDKNVLPRLRGLGFASICCISDSVRKLLRRRKLEALTFDNDP